MRKLARSDIADDRFTPLQAAIPQARLPSARPQPSAPEAVAEIARYIADLVAEMESMAGTARLEMLAYFLALARMEAETAARLPLAASEPETQAAYRATA